MWRDSAGSPANILLFHPFVFHDLDFATDEVVLHEVSSQLCQKALLRNSAVCLVQMLRQQTLQLTRWCLTRSYRQPLQIQLSAV